MSPVTVQSPPVVDALRRLHTTEGQGLLRALIQDVKIAPANDMAAP